ncbi:hypothetical protein NK214_11990 [Chromobacterium sp. S0633]|uniref:hypothetical protein n=1 Tax=Chromobacterium sp. S0633 TaxID=2957805 RepID=UPI0020A0FC9B|nr:hypothetical protein [Chromobacterium sp. S0633]MCP1290910.1 hypothetical protein [Chromobacterium sp. S0633]
MPKVLLITGGHASDKARVANVAKQIAEQHHNAATKVHGLDPAAAAPGLLIPAPGLGKQLLVVVKKSGQHQNVRAFRVINLDRFARFPRGKAVTFAIREAVDACLAAS